MATNPADNGHPGGDYYVSVTGTIQAQANPILADGLKALGWTGPFDWAGAKAQANNVAKRTLEGAANYASAATDPAVTAGADAAQNAAPAAPNIIGDITGFHGSNFVIRAAKVIIGGTLVIVGLAHMSGADNSIAQAARKIPLPM